jgi:hypothetical protein
MWSKLFSVLFSWGYGSNAPVPKLTGPSDERILSIIIMQPAIIEQILSVISATLMQMGHSKGRAILSRCKETAHLRRRSRA